MHIAVPITVAALAMLFLTMPPRAAFVADPARISGLATVIDGDTLTVAGISVRLKGVDAAELGTPRGEDARSGGG